MSDRVRASVGPPIDESLCIFAGVGPRRRLNDLQTLRRFVGIRKPVSSQDGGSHRRPQILGQRRCHSATTSALMLATAANNRPTTRAPQPRPRRGPDAERRILDGFGADSTMARIDCYLCMSGTRWFLAGGPLEQARSSAWCGCCSGWQIDGFREALSTVTSRPGSWMIARSVGRSPC